MSLKEWREHIKPARNIPLRKRLWEDALFVDGKHAGSLLSTEFSLGVADGVGGREHGIDPSEFVYCLFGYNFCRQNELCNQ